MKENKNKKSLSLMKEEADLLYWMLDRISDYFALDDRPDHGLARLKEIRDIPTNLQQRDENSVRLKTYMLAGKLNRMRRRFG